MPKKGIKKKALKKSSKKTSAKRRKFYITTSIAYANAAPHIGHALEVVQADAIARYRRSIGDEVFFLTGTDEHGDKINRVAQASGKAAKEFVDEISAKFKGLKKTLSLSWDGFVRTSDKKKHWPGVYKIFERLEKSGDIYKKEYEGLYCVGCEKFLTEKDLENGECPLHRKAPEKVTEENYFFRLSRYAKKIEEAIGKGKLKIVPETRKNEIMSFLSEGLEDISFSRSAASVPWGIPIKGSDQTIYVWCDALSNYISAIGYGRNEESFALWWPADVQLIGKDIYRFHAIFWPAMLMSAKLPLPKRLYIHGFVSIDGQKMSKSIGNVVDPEEIAEKYGIDAVRYYFLKEIPSDGDGDYSEVKLIQRYNDDLAKGIGNFASRITNLADGLSISSRFTVSPKIKKEIIRAEKRIAKHMDEFRIHDAMAALMDLMKFGDGYINEKQPWKNKDQKVLKDLAVMLSEFNRLLEPFLPDAAKKIAKGIPVKNGSIKVKKLKPIFPRIDK